MDPTRWQAIQDWLDRARELAPAERAAFELELRRDAPELADEVLSLLGHEPDAAWLNPGIDAVLGASGAPATSELAPGSRLGPLRIERHLGRGGIGEVYLAARVDGAFDALVAVKVVKRGMDSRAILERFRRERQVLADLSHAGIARLLDAGDTADGRPYLVMEYVDGVPIDAYCAEHDLDPRAIVQLVRRLCAAVEHAHARGVLHRDLKPHNILVTADGEPRLLDFGLAKMLDPTGDGVSEHTAPEERILTPHYASPEQLRGTRVGPTSDVYSLGVVLYELLSGRRPLEFQSSSFAGIERIVATRDPLPPSRAARSDDSARARTWDADLDTIVLMALRKEPERRYESVALFESDLGRFLDGRPVRARPDTLAYRVSKYVRRHKTAVFSAGGIGLLAVVGAGAAAQFYRERGAIKHVADAHKSDVRDLSRQLLFDVQNALRDLPGALELRRRVVSEAQTKLESLADKDGDPALFLELAQAHLALGDALGEPGSANLGRYGEAAASYARALELLALVPADPHVDRLALRTRLRLARTEGLAGEAAASRERLRELLGDLDARLANEPDRDHAQTRSLASLRAETRLALGRALATSFDFAASEPLLRELEADCRADHAAALDDPVRTDAWIWSLIGLGDALQRSGRFTEAVEHLRTAVALLEEDCDDAMPCATLLQAQAILAFAVGADPTLEPNARRAEADALFAALRPGYDALVAQDREDSRRLAGRQRSLFYEGRHFEREARFEEARDAFTHCAESRRELARRAPDDLGLRIQVAEVEDMLAWCLIRLELPEDALATLERSSAVFAEAAAADPDNAQRRRAVCVNAYYRGVGRELTIDADGPRERQIDGWNDAREHFSVARAILEELEAEGRISAGDRGMIGSLRELEATCSERIEALASDE